MDVTELVSALYFAICLTLSSTILVVGALKSLSLSESLLGQTTLGLMVLQDITAVISISIVASFDPAAGDVDLGAAVGLIFAKLAILIVVLLIVKFTILDKACLHFALEEEMLQLGVLGFLFFLSYSIMDLCTVQVWIRYSCCLPRV
jgi:Kef-type K+ transport system membrane component KefB